VEELRVRVRVRDRVRDRVRNRVRFGHLHDVLAREDAGVASCLVLMRHHPSE